VGAGVGLRVQFAVAKYSNRRHRAAAAIFPLLLAGIFKIAGAYSLTSLWIAVSLNALFSALTAVFILRLGKRDFGEMVGIVAAWIWAFGSTKQSCRSGSGRAA
jgi:hypothetical protein